MTSRRRSATSLVEVMLAVAVGSMLFIQALGFWQRGMLTMKSDHEKMSAWRKVHVTGEVVHREFFGAQFAWIMNGKDEDSKGYVENHWSGVFDWMKRELEGKGPQDATPTVEKGKASAQAASHRLFTARRGPFGEKDQQWTEYWRDTRNGTVTREGEGLTGPLLMFGATWDGPPDHPNIMKFLIVADDHTADVSFERDRETAPMISSLYLEPQDNDYNYSRFTIGEPDHGTHAGFSDN